MNNRLSKSTALSELNRRVEFLSADRISVIEQDYSTGFVAVSTVRQMIAEADEIWWSPSMTYNHHLTLSWRGRVYYLDTPDPLAGQRLRYIPMGR